MSPVMSKATPQVLCSSKAPKSVYRRSRTTKAPRKRTFLVTMQKPDMQALAETSAARGTHVASAVAGKDMYSVCFGGIDGGNGAGFGGSNNGGSNNNNFGGRSWNDDAGNSGSSQPGRFPFAAVLGAMVLSFGVIAPLPSIAAPLELIDRFAASRSNSTPAAALGSTLPKAVALRSATLVIPNAGNMSLARKSAPNSIVYGKVYITDDEKRHADNTQFNAREALRVY